MNLHASGFQLKYNKPPPLGTDKDREDQAVSGALIKGLGGWWQQKHQISSVCWVKHRTSVPSHLPETGHLKEMSITLLQSLPCPPPKFPYHLWTQSHILALPLMLWPQNLPIQILGTIGRIGEPVAAGWLTGKCGPLLSPGAARAENYVLLKHRPLNPGNLLTSINPQYCSARKGLVSTPRKNKQAHVAVRTPKVLSGSAHWNPGVITCSRPCSLRCSASLASIEHLLYAASNFNALNVFFLVLKKIGYFYHFTECWMRYSLFHTVLLSNSPGGCMLQWKIGVSGQLRPFYNHMAFHNLAFNIFSSTPRRCWLLSTRNRQYLD